MAAGIRGRLITATFAKTLLHTLPGVTAPPSHFAAALDGWGHRRHETVGPASSVRTIADAVIAPLLAMLGFAVRSRDDDTSRVLLIASCGDGSIPALVVGWDEPLRQAWRATVLGAVRADRRWCFCSNGRALRIVDAHQTWSREYLEFDLALLPVDPEAQRVLWGLVRAEACAAVPPLLDAAVVASARQGVAVCRALGEGVLDALTFLVQAFAAGRAVPAAAFEQSLTIVYRLLFLLFAEARGLVPVWHPVYRDRYTIESIVSTLVSGRRYRGLSQTLQAISRLAHDGCSAGELKVTAFNGRLFAPARPPVFDRVRLDDRVMAHAVLAISTTTAAGTAGRSRIAYRDLDVEQLGAVYEHVLEYEPASSGPAVLDRTRDVRRSTGTFYTPRAVTDYLVRHTLAPLTAGRSSDDLLALRILDPAMGSGAFLVAACRHLADAVEEARVREGAWHPGDVTPADRAMLRRDIALRCLFGVDLNPMAVQLARLSIWLASLAADKPLTFLDHHLVAGNSLLGASLDDLRRQPSRGGGARRTSHGLPLFDSSEFAPVIQDAIRTRLRLTSEPDDAVAVVHRKERDLAALSAHGAPLRSWARVLDLWCAGWFWDEGDPPSAGVAADMCDYFLHRRCTLPGHIAAAFAEKTDVVSARHRFLHWHLAFPEVFADQHGEALANPGFDAIVGNPPWDMVRGDSGDAHVRPDRREDARRLTDFVREAGVYQVAARSHVNRYQLFLERALQLTRRGGRVGLVLPSGLASDSGSAGLRIHLFDRAEIDSITGLDNRHGLFPIHRSVRFVLLTGTVGRPTTQIACRFGLSRNEELEAPGEAAAPSLMLTRRLLSRLSGDDNLAVPELTTSHDLAIVEKIGAAVPALGAAGGWHVQFGRELNATDDREAFVPYSGSAWARPVLEGKQIEPFRSFPDRARLELSSESLTSRRVPRRARLAYRDVASATNRLTLIAAIVPARCVTTHTLFCLKTPLPLDNQHVLCALLNSFVANYLVRLRVTTHVTASLLARLPVPPVSSHEAVFRQLASLSRMLSAGTSAAEDAPQYAELQAIVATLYHLTSSEFAHILDTFPLVPTETRSRVFTQFNSLH
jgi:hypothetical protein